jgi:hypothetical protein
MLIVLAYAAIDAGSHQVDIEEISANWRHDASGQRDLYM